MEKLFNPDYLQHLCQKYGLRPSKQYGQNFLLNEEVVQKMVEAGDVSKKDEVIEVGPGFGVLTFSLCEKAGKVMAYEIEKKIQPYWEEKQKEYKNLEIIWGNVLNSQKSIKSAKSLRSPEEMGKYKVVANLPYQITSQIIRFFLEQENKPESMVVMVQKEVGERICAKPGDLSVLGISVQYFGEPEIIAFVSRNDFYPAPKVDSAVIKIVLKKKLPKIDEKEFFAFVRAGFINKRKLLIKNLKNYLGDKNKKTVDEAFAKMEFPENIRAQELSLEEWLRLFSIINSP
ncbi:MAG TPA: 16S rRNA (adenine(1518)-N(6)/adenine(1519)-N(6))-dimethyltransferase RsmA [Candidatus Magasanikbacteria bacterium]|nr:16S rRNA (adenine(1518)-N(6)/adenine(1519)-N(6))-dimethyltransferase RsmA [Candidatus Magasanikbacteria bacterium]